MDEYDLLIAQFEEAVQEYVRGTVDAREFDRRLAEIRTTYQNVLALSNAVLPAGK